MGNCQSAASCCSRYISNCYLTFRVTAGLDSEDQEALSQDSLGHRQKQINTIYINKKNIYVADIPKEDKGKYWNINFCTFLSVEEVKHMLVS